MDTNSLSQSLDSVNTAVSVAGEEEVSPVSPSLKHYITLLSSLNIISMFYQAILLK